MNNSISTIELRTAGEVVLDLIEIINANRVYLSEIDGAIGDGDHGINMSKGFSMCRDRLIATTNLPGLAEAFDVLGLTLLEDIGGSMGPLYGSFFLAWADTLNGHVDMDAVLFGDALKKSLEAVQDMGDARVGDKTLIDTLSPACDAYAAALAAGSDFDAALAAMMHAAEAGKESTRALQARIGRASRLGARSIGVLDAGATSCFLLLQSLGTSLQRRLH